MLKSVLIVGCLVACTSSNAQQATPQVDTKLLEASKEVILNTVKQLVDYNSQLQALAQADQAKIAELQGKLTEAEKKSAPPGKSEPPK